MSEVKPKCDRSMLQDSRSTEVGRGGKCGDFLIRTALALRHLSAKKASEMSSPNLGTD